MNIWIFNHHAVTPDMGGGTRHYDFARELIKRGHNVTIVASSFHYAKYAEMREYGNLPYLQENIDGINFIWIKTSPYGSNGLKRVKNMLEYLWRVLEIIPVLDIKKPDIVIGSSVHLFAVWAAQKLSVRYNVPFVMEVRDLWPQTLIDMGISKWHPFILLLGWMERYLYKKADAIITLLPDAGKYIGRFTQEDKIHWISNGAVLQKEQVFPPMLPASKFNVLYAGTHGLANDLEILVKTAEALGGNTNIHFTMIGDGPLKKSLEKMASEKGLENITFLSSVAKEELSPYLQSADLLYVGLKDLPLYRYGISMNKIFEYMRAKKPVLFVSSLSNNIIEECHAGIVVKSYKVQDVAAAILAFSKMSPQELQLYGLNGYNCIQKNFDIEVLSDKLENVLNSLIRGQNVE